MGAHQTMTDMALIVTITGAMEREMAGMHTYPEAPVRVYEVALGRTRLRLSAYHLVIGAVIACALPQILYLFSRNVELSHLRFHGDAFMSGSAGNCGLPGNEPCRPQVPA